MELYDLGFEEKDPDEKNPGVNVYNNSDDPAEEHSKNSASGQGVKVLSEKMGSLDNFQKDGVNFELVPVSIEGLSEEFRDMLQMN